MLKKGICFKSIMQGNFEKFVEKVAKASGLEKDEIIRRIDAKQAKLSGLITREGAAQIVASELRVNLENEKLKIDELIPSMRKVNTCGKVINLFPVRGFKTKKGEDSKVANLIIADETSNIKVVLWDTNHIGLIEKGEIILGSVVEIANGSMRGNEIHLGSFSEFKPSKERIENVVTARVIRKKTIKDLINGDNAQIRAFIVQSFEPRFFNVCPQCKKKVVPNEDGVTFTCDEHGGILPEKRALINIVIDDGTETMRAVLFHENVMKLGVGIGMESFSDIPMIMQQRENLLGKEFLLSGNIRQNNYFNYNEFIVNDVEEVNLDELIKELESSN